MLCCASKSCVIISFISLAEGNHPSQRDSSVTVLGGNYYFYSNVNYHGEGIFGSEVKGDCLIFLELTNIVYKMRKHDYFEVRGFTTAGTVPYPIFFNLLMLLDATPYSYLWWIQDILEFTFSKICLYIY